jgi:hypothetical protein
MAGGITHILLMKYLPNILPDDNLKKELTAGRDFLIIGAIAPDLPYAINTDEDFFFKPK